MIKTKALTSVAVQKSYWMVITGPFGSINVQYDKMFLFDPVALGLKSNFKIKILN